jgi:hypothetical protein
MYRQPQEDWENFLSVVDDSNVELNDTRSNQTSSPMYLSSPKKERGRDKIKSTRNMKVPKVGKWANCCQSMVESRGSHSNEELNDTLINQTSSPMEN